MEDKLDKTQEQVAQAKAAFLEWCHILFGTFWKSFIWGVAFICFSLLFLTKGTFVQGFLKELGVAFVIGSIISIGIEEVSRREHNESVNKKMDDLSRNVIEAVYNRNFPDSVFRHIENHIIEKPFIKSDIEIEFTFNLLEGRGDDVISSDDPVIVTMKSSYKVRNTSNSTEQFKAYVFIEKPWAKNLESHCKITLFSIGGSECSEEDLKNANEKVADDDDFFRYQFPDEEMRSGDILEVELEYQYVKYARDATTWQSIHASEGAKVSLIFDMDIFTMNASEIHPCSVKSNRPATSGVGLQTKHFRFSGPLLPYNGIEIWWCPKSALVAEKQDSVNKET